MTLSPNLTIYAHTPRNRTSGTLAWIDSSPRLDNDALRPGSIYPEARITPSVKDLWYPTSTTKKASVGVWKEGVYWAGPPPHTEYWEHCFRAYASIDLNELTADERFYEIDKVQLFLRPHSFDVVPEGLKGNLQVFSHKRISPGWVTPNIGRSDSDYNENRKSTKLAEVRHGIFAAKALSGSWLGLTIHKERIDFSKRYLDLVFTASKEYFHYSRTTGVYYPNVSGPTPGMTPEKKIPRTYKFYTNDINLKVTYKLKDLPLEAETWVF